MHTSSEAVLRCVDVWKVFGPGAWRLSDARERDFESTFAASTGLVAAVRGATLEVSCGECFCIMGLSGSGKSTLVRCMTGLIPLTRGRIDVLGVDLTRASKKELIGLRRHNISMVFQDFALLPHLSALENVAFPLRVQGISRAERDRRARKLLALVGLEEREDYYPHELSGGQQQRVGIARSLSTDPGLWFLDEPFSALDPLIREDLQDELLKLQALLRKTIVFITHDFGEALRLASRIAIMRDGRLVQVDTPEQLVLAPADDYVARFTRKVNLADVARVSSIMQRAPANSQDSDPVPSTALVRDVAARVLQENRALPVANALGEIVGSISPQAITSILLRRGERREA